MGKRIDLGPLLQRAILDPATLTAEEKQLLLDRADKITMDAADKAAVAARSFASRLSSIYGEVMEDPQKAGTWVVAGSMTASDEKSTRTCGGARFSNLGWLVIDHLRQNGQIEQIANEIRARIQAGAADSEE
jgi:hypothetical protein